MESYEWYRYKYTSYASSSVVEVFIVRQKTAYELLRSIVGSDICIQKTPYAI